MPTLQIFFRIALLSAGPQDLPYSLRLLRLLAVLYLASGVMVSQLVMVMETAIASMLVDLVVVFLYSHLLLRSLGRSARFVQTVTALLGFGILYHLVALPLFMQTGMVDGRVVIGPMASLFSLMLMSWGLLVNAHLYRNALECGLVSAILLSFALFSLSYAISAWLFPGA